MYRFPGAGRRLAQLVALILVMFIGGLSVSGAHRDSTAFAATPAAQLIYVDGAQGTDSATCGANPGPAACQTISYALDHRTTAGSTVSVAAGTYYETITLRPGVAVQGAGADVTTIDGNGAGPVVTADGAAIGDTVVLSGFTITGGQATQGAGITVRNGAAPIIEHNVLQGNTADFGGAMHIDACSPTVRDNTIRDNSATSNAGGIYVWQGAPSISGNTIQGNSSEWGGGLFINHSAAVVSSNTVSNNSAIQGGGGLYVFDYATATISSNRIENNQAPGTDSWAGGGGLAIGVDCSPTVIGNFIRGNTAVYGGGIKINIDSGNPPGTLTAHGNIVCGNSGYQFYNETATAVDITGNWWGTNTPGAAQLYGPATYSPAIALTLSANPTTVIVPGASTVQATLQGGDYTVPNGTILTWSTTLGTLNPPSSATANGSAQTSLSSAATGTASVAATDPCGFTVTAAVNFVIGRAYLPLLAR